MTGLGGGGVDRLCGGVDTSKWVGGLIGIGGVYKDKR